jgi:hypothetical protein
LTRDGHGELLGAASEPAAKGFEPRTPDDDLGRAKHALTWTALDSVYGRLTEVYVLGLTGVVLVDLDWTGAEARSP